MVVVCQRYLEEGGNIRDDPGTAEKRRENKALARTWLGDGDGTFDRERGPKQLAGEVQKQIGATLHGVFKKMAFAFELSSNL
ncbi:hypothetical protein [Sinorhizobium medicae]|uniref:hypothetical protein n=1 Tax=Sinorhizobium medicae TaxID=110321 RepID=UPI0013E3B466|nr:hypothetical protein [Sinorhizobium medicae]